MFKKLGERVLWQRVADFLATYKPLVVGVTGSTGKTITREAIVLALQDAHRSRTSTHSFHAPRDVALAILGIDSVPAGASWFTPHLSSRRKGTGFTWLVRSFAKEVSTPEPETIVVEVGAHRPGDVDAVSQRIPFNVVVVTNVGTTHTDLFSSKEMVAHELTSAVVTLPADSIAVLNADDPLVAAMGSKTKAQVVTFGESPHAHVRIARTTRRPAMGLAVTVVIDNKSHELHLPQVTARHHATKVVAALAVAHALGVALPGAVQRLQKFVSPPGRLRKLAGKSGAILLDDSYSASPEVTAAALSTLKAFTSGRRIAVLGDMQGLGALSRRSHQELGEQAATVAHIVIAVGEEMRVAGREALRAGADVHQFDEAGEVGKWLVDFLQPGDAVLIAGSREMHMERVVERLLANPEEDRDKLVH